MNKINKDQIQKIILSSLMMAGLVYCYFTFLIGPLGKQDANNAVTLEDLSGKLEKAGGEVKRSHAAQEQAKSAEETLAQVGDMIPEGAPIAWFPPRLHAFFDRHNLKNVGIQSGGIDAASDPNMGGFRNAKWTVDLPQAGMAQLGIAVAGLENEEKLLEINHLQITASVDSPEKQRVTMNVQTLLK